MSGVLRVAPEVLRGHAGVVGGVADQVAVARAAAVRVVWGREAYGRLCQFLPGMVEQTTTAAVDALAAAVEVARETGDRLAQVASGYERADASAQAGLGGYGWQSW